MIDLRNTINMNFNLNKNAKEKTKYLKHFKEQYDDYEHDVINTSQTIKDFVKLKENNIVKNKKTKRETFLSSSMCFS